MSMATPHGVRRLDELAGGAGIVHALGRSPERIHAALADGDHRAQRVVGSGSTCEGQGPEEPGPLGRDESDRHHREAIRAGIAEHFTG